MKNFSNTVFEEAFASLNKSQQEAVKAIEGPVMVIAGPGTGKTQLLAVRVGYLLQQTDISPHNILCLSFTEAGVTAMRQRLISFIGPEAYHIGIYTYHAFCNKVIRDNPDYFDGARELSNAEELEQYVAVEQLLDKLPDKHILNRLTGDPYYEAKHILGVFTTMKKEGWSEEHILKAVKEEKELMLTDDKYRYQRKSGNNLKGDIKKELYEKALEKLNKLVAAAELFGTYNAKLREASLIDFDDSIMLVKDVFHNHPELLLDYQEQFQYILADEYQDTNGSQNAILFSLADYENPNIFVVGDDDQSIYRFQGANMTNIEEFRERFNPIDIVLDQNYRSDQNILDRASSLIGINKERLGYKYAHLQKNLIESRKAKPENALPHGVSVLDFPSKEAQDIFVINTIKLLHDKGVRYDEIALLGRKHAEFENIVKNISTEGIPYRINKRVNVLKQKDVSALIDILKYYVKESSEPFEGDDLLFKILHIGGLGLHPLEIAKLSVFAGQRVDQEDDTIDARHCYREVLSNPKLLEQAGVKDIERMLAVSHKIETLMSIYMSSTIQVFIEAAMADLGIINDIMKSGDATWRLQSLNTFFDFVKNQHSIKPNLEISEFLSKIDKMIARKLDLGINYVVDSEDAITITTAHGAKGLEYPYIFVLNSNNNHWTVKRKSGFSYPSTLTRVSDLESIEDDRRLYYVAMTRAENHAFLTYVTDINKKVDAPAPFIAEMGLSDSVVKPEIVEADVNLYLSNLLSKTEHLSELIDKDYVISLLKDFALSSSGAYKYLTCKTNFYFENILRVPQARTASMGYGNALHFALEKLMIQVNQHPNRDIPAIEVLLQLFGIGMEKFRSHFTKKEFESHLIAGKLALTLYYNTYSNDWKTARDIKVEVSINSVYGDIPIRGILDKVDIYDDHVVITDYKSGAYDSSNHSKPKCDDQLPDGGKYWFQMGFYRLLTDGHPEFNWKVKDTIMDYISHKEEKVKRVQIEINDGEKSLIGNQLKIAYEGIRNLDFTPGCGECRWCSFVEGNMKGENLESHRLGD